MIPEVIIMVARLKELRQNKGISQQKLAEILGISQQAVNKYENHSIEPDIWTLIALASYFEVSVDYLIGHTDIPHIIEPISRFELNAQEAHLIECWRKMRPKERESITLVIENYLD